MSDKPGGRRYVHKLRALLAGLATLALPAILYACGGEAQQAPPTPTAIAVAQAVPTFAEATPTAETAAAASPTPWAPPTALVGTPIAGAVATLTAAPALKTGVVTITNKAGEKVQMMVEIADTEASRELGLMFRPSMAPDAGMLFVFDGDTTSGFWMANTILPLSIAFITADGTILNIEDMQPLDTNTTSAAGPYRYTIEANQGFFRAHNIAAGDKVTLPGQQSLLTPGMPNVGGR